MKLCLFFLLLWLSLIAWGSSVFAQADQSANAWAGEWGEYRSLATLPSGIKQYRGERLAISDCSGQTCKLQISVTSDAGRCDSSGQASLQIQSASSATASLSDFSYKCSIELQKSGTASSPVIAAVKSTGDCNDFCTPGADFNHNFPLHARTHYVGSNIEDCYLGTSQTQMAVCSSQELAEKENKWDLFSDEVFGLEGKRLDSSAAKAQLQQKCDHSADPTTCLNAELERATVDLEYRKQAWLKRITEPGDAMQAAAKIAAIAGHYRRTFESGDVQGETFKVTDKLQISKLSDTSIHYL
jgi:hypothetical protein